MIYLFATILLNVGLAVLFKLFPRFSIDTLQAIVVNYIVCVITGCFFLGNFPIQTNSIQQEWAPWAILMGVCFFSLFFLIGFCTKKEGITTTTIANKLSLVISVAFSIVLYGEQISMMKIAGVLIAFPAVYFSTRQKEGEKKTNHLLLPAILFLGSGLLDTLVKYVEQGYLKSSELQASYTIHSFSAAAIVGVLTVGSLYARKKIKFSWKNVLAGMCLGVPNYFSIYFLIRLLNSRCMQSSAIIPVNNISILLLSTLIAIYFFKEKMTQQKVFGILLSFFAILLIYFSEK
jgi:drug/metabolite transporter (DMT)-like permease